jgi:hypothetical protein
MTANKTDFDGWVSNIRFWHITTFRGNAAIWSFLEWSGHSARRTYQTEFMSMRPYTFPPTVPRYTSRLSRFGETIRHCLSQTMHGRSHESNLAATQGWQWLDKQHCKTARDK